MTVHIPFSAGRMIRKMRCAFNLHAVPASHSAMQVSRHLLLCLLIVGSLKSFGQSAATKVVITTQPVPGANGSPMSVQPVVEIRNASDQLVTTSTAQVVISIASGAGGSIGGTTKINAVNGVATFTDLTLSGIANEPYVFAFKSEPVIASEPFAYTGGATLTGNNGGTGWSGAWFSSHPTFPDLTVNGTGFTYTNFTTSGGRTTYTSGTSGDGGRQLAAASNAAYNVIWLAFIGNYTQQGGGSNNLRLLNSSSVVGGVGGNDNYANWSILNSLLQASTFTSSPLNGTTRLALLKFDYTAGTSSLWMDPAVSSFDGTQTPSMTVNFAPVFDRIDLYNKLTGVGTDEITLASTYKAALHLEQNLTADFSLAATLPVKWKYFTASCDHDVTLLKWGTTDEIGNSHFLVEKSSDALVWSTVGTVEGVGNSTVDQHYQYRDSALSSKSYYRLRQVDFNSKADLSKVVVVSCEVTVDKKLRVFPNPVGDILYFAGAAPGSRFKLIDARGHVVRTGIVQGGTMAISLSTLRGGSFFLRVDGYNQPIKVLKVGAK